MIGSGSTRARSERPPGKSSRRKSLERLRQRACPGFFVDERHGSWQTAVELRLPATALMAGRNGGVVSVSCVSVGNCSGGAAYLDAAGNYQASIVNQVNGVWHSATKLALPSGAASVGVDGGVYGLVCPTRGPCTAVGSYLKDASNYAGFTVSTQ